MSDTTTNTETSQTEIPQISVAELQRMVQFVDVAAKRGAYEASEFTIVGTTRDKFVAFIAAVSPPVEPTVEPVAEPEKPTTSTRKAKSKK